MSEKMEAKIRYLEMIQNVIQRMASNSFQLKGWTVTLISIIYAIIHNSADVKTFALLFLLLLAFWSLDAYYLQLERSYRLLYKVVVKGNKEVDFAMDPYMEQVECGGDNKINYWNCFWSITEKGFYLPVGIIVAIIIIAKVCFK